jgi:phage tail P2-like protein
MSSILPLNEEQLQRDIEAIGTNTIAKFDENKLKVDPLNCDVSLLPHLAVDLDVSIAGLDETEARTYLQNAREIKKYIGSPYAVRKAAESIFGETIEVQPWYKHNGVPGTYKFDISVTANKTVDEENIAKTIRLVDEAKRESTHLSGITMYMKNSGFCTKALATQSSETVTILPKEIQGIECSANVFFASAIHTIETTTIRPLGV